MTSSMDKNEITYVDEKPGSTHAEKPHQIVQIDNIQVLGISPEDADFYMNFSPEKRKKVIHKVDKRLVPMLAILYLISHIDRANIGNAKIEGMVEDLGLTGVQWNIVLSVFFVPYILLEIPSNILLKKFKRPSYYLGILIFCWGIIMTMMGVVKGFTGLLITRILLGVFEAGFFPGAVYLCTYWYMPRDLATRISYFYCASALSGAFSGILAAGIAKMDGVGGYEGWRWIFLLEGIFTVMLGISCFFLLIDSPALSGRWLKPDEIRFLELQRFIKDGGKFQEEKGESFKWHDLKMVLCNWRLYMQAYILLCISACSYGTKFTLPTITKGMGFTNTNAQLMTVPPYVAGAISAIVFARLSDRFYWRLPFIAIPLSFIFIGYSIVISLKGNLGGNLGPAFFAIILTCMGIYPIQPAGSSWASNNLAPTSRRAIGVAFNICVGNIGGVIGSYMYLEAEKPKYYTGFGLSLAFGASGFIVAFLLELSYKWGNTKKAKMSEDEVRAKYTDEELLNMGDKSPLFRYTL
ncbi:MFS general substrate transporter [Cucurbitaria berberidis CBS 394.84]|uniref:MFS general substrate transporter n=1 Tax=Cucurbitaria berberidis CBS 394.84 TaxID=1168544 RepID=A0A9P4GMI4_9PLEO|nr:MFS general substrate transporter [Cucurbitaria berberidis CBS 394.84]KAF1848174.1 MFS general substrate transporter [Cucurbitaria berberidis CBS 394.84]